MSTGSVNSSPDPDQGAWAEFLGRHSVEIHPPEAVGTTLFARTNPPRIVFSGSVTVFPYPAPVGRDMHLPFEIEVVLAGQLEKHFEDWSTSLHTGAICLTAPWEPHSWQAQAPGTTSLVAHFLPEFLGGETVDRLLWIDLFTAAPRDRPRIQNPAMTKQVLGASQELAQELEEGRQGWLTAAKLCVLKLLLIIGREWVLPETTRRNRLTASNLARLAPATNLINRYAERRVTLTEAAAACGLNRSYFSTLFSATMGMGFAEFSARFRLSRAAELLLNSSLALDKIAARSGFADASHLHHWFTRVYGRTPAQYREQAAEPTDGEESSPAATRGK